MCGSSQAEFDQVQHRLLTLQLQTKRLASVFKGKIEEFRKASNHCGCWVPVPWQIALPMQAVQSLTGYRIDLHDTGERQYHLYLPFDLNKVLRFRCNAHGARVATNMPYPFPVNLCERQPEWSNVAAWQGTSTK